MTCGSASFSHQWVTVKGSGEFKREEHNVTVFEGNEFCQVCGMVRRVEWSFPARWELGRGVMPRG